MFVIKSCFNNSSAFDLLNLSSFQQQEIKSLNSFDHLVLSFKPIGGDFIISS